MCLCPCLHFAITVNFQGHDFKHVHWILMVLKSAIVVLSWCLRSSKPLTVFYLLSLILIMSRSGFFLKTLNSYWYIIWFLLLTEPWRLVWKACRDSSPSLCLSPHSLSVAVIWWWSYSWLLSGSGKLLLYKFVL